MARPRLDRPVLGKPQRVLIRPRKKDGEVAYLYGYFVDEAGQEHRIPGGNLITSVREVARRMAEDWLAGIRDGVTLVHGTAHARNLFLKSLGCPGESNYADYDKRTRRFCRYIRWRDTRKITFSDWERFLLPAQ